MGYQTGRESMSLNAKLGTGQYLTSGQTEMFNAQQNRALTRRGQSLQDAANRRQVRYNYWNSWNNLKIQQAILDQQSGGGGIGGMLGSIGGSILGSIGGPIGSAIGNRIGGWIGGQAG